ncbi:DNA repair protein RadA [Candidiatus Paracoxiella cheracis]|uniref:DNA repair protein RadA n=1 Tax=Candidiatus Paracoxiella cheracis TaxID=3405120 RepID=UPI003BF4AD17
MVKTKTIYACQHCGSQYSKWQGQCSECGKWNTIVEEVAVSKSSHRRSSGYAGTESAMTLLADVQMQAQARLATGLAEFDHVLGGGLVSDSVVLIGGDPGVGKSTVLLQILSQLSKNYRPLYVTGEESLQQIALRAERLGLARDKLTLLAETNVERIIALAQQYKPQVMVIDSVQTVYTELVQSAPGGVGQVRESAAQLVQYAKQSGTALFLVGHVTKEGSIAGPRVLEHMVDAVLYFEGRNDSKYRVIRAVKNRFGAINEIGVFAMTDKGLKQVNNPSAIFLSHYEAPVSGSVVMVTWEGSRPLLVEVQALVDESHLANPRRVTVGLDHNRLSMLLATLHRHGGVATYDQDVFVNVVGGLRVVETGADLAIVLSVLSSLRNKPLPSDLVVFGEVGLAGEIRPVSGGQERLKEAKKHGFKRAIVPKANAPKSISTDIEVIAVERLQQALSE